MSLSQGEKLSETNHPVKTGWLSRFPVPRQGSGRPALRGLPVAFPGYGHAMFMLVRRVAAALSMTGMVAALFRIRGTGGVPPQTEGWREVTGSDLR